MQVTREELNPCTVKLSVTCASDQVRNGFDRAYKQLAKRVRIPGFRPGHAPKNLVAQQVDPAQIYEIAGDFIVRDAFKKILTDEKLQPHSTPSLELTKLDENAEVCEFVAKVPLPPVVELGEYKGISVEVEAIEVTDDEVERQLEEMRRRESKQEAVTGRSAQTGDMAVVNIKVDGEEGDGRTFMTIVGQTFAELDATLEGMEVEEIKIVDLTFPEGFQEKDWAGKKHHCRVNLRSLSTMAMPELDESFAKSLNSESVDDLKGRMKVAIERAKEAFQKDYISEQLLDKLMKSSQIHVPDTMWESVTERRLSDIAREQAQQGKTMEQYASEHGMTMEDLLKSWTDEAKMHVMRAVLIQEIFKKEEMKLSNQELNDELILMAREYRVQPDDLLRQLKKAQAFDELYFRATFSKVTAFLAEHAEKVEGAAAPKEAKPAAKKAKKKAE